MAALVGTFEYAASSPANQCGLEGMQSPIDIPSGATESDPGLRSLEFGEATAEGAFRALEGTERPVALVANLYTWKAAWIDPSVPTNFSAETSVLFGGSPYYLVEVLFHSPSEHTVDGRRFPVEAHLVHRTTDLKGTLIIAVLLQLGGDNAYLSRMWPFFPTNLSVSQPAVLPPPYEQFLPADRSYWYYTGSLTTPPCTVGVAWAVMQRPVAISRRQVSDFRAGISSMVPNRLLVQMGDTPKGVHMPWNQELGLNNRPLQTLGERTVAAYAAPSPWGWLSLVLVPGLGVLSLIALGMSLGLLGESSKSSGTCEIRTLSSCRDARFWEFEPDEEDGEDGLPADARPVLSKETGESERSGGEYQTVPQEE